MAPMDSGGRDVGGDRECWINHSRDMCGIKSTKIPFQNSISKCRVRIAYQASEGSVRGGRTIEACGGIP